jgi:hypothetical protein
LGNGLTRKGNANFGGLLDSGRRKVKFSTGGAAYVKLDTLRKISKGCPP